MTEEKTKEGNVLKKRKRNGVEERKKNSHERPLKRNPPNTPTTSDLGTQDLL